LVLLALSGARAWAAALELEAAPPVTVAATVGPVGNWSPHLATNGAGTWIAVWQAGVHPGFMNEPYVARSTDDGLTWSPPQRLAPGVARGSDFDRASPHIATDRSGTWIVAWHAVPAEYIPGVQGNSDVFLARSTDDGVTWTVTGRVDGSGGSQPTFTSDVYPDLASGIGGGWMVVWLSAGPYVGVDFPYPGIYRSRSSDGGATWSAGVPLSDDTTNDPAEEYGPYVASDRHGTWLTGWYAIRGTYVGTKSFLLRSTDDGITWSDRPAIDPFAGNAGGPRVSTDGNGFWIALWDRVTGAMAARSFDGGMTWTAPETVAAPPVFTAPDVATSDDGTSLVVWNEHNTRWMSWSPRQPPQGIPWSAPVVLSSTGRAFPVLSTARVASDGRRTWVVAWEAADEAAETTHIALARVALVESPTIAELARRLVARFPDAQRGDRVAKSLARLGRKLVGQARRFDEQSGRRRRQASRLVRSLTQALLRKARNAAAKDRLGVDLAAIEAAATKLLDRLQ
ncbi:MAG TPA: sialidase family protein, partial [Candidatus Binatia bacterium]|nr:sialidase family protein [Candidatus Binatia bacterium]